MKNLMFIFTAIFGFFFLTANASPDTLTVKTSAECGACKERIENKLNFTKGVKNVNLDVKSKDAIVIFDSKKITPEEIRTVISKTGYDADNVPANEKAYNKLPKCCKKGGMAGH